MNDAFEDDAAAVRLFEERRWRFGIVCPHCGAAGRMGRVQRADGASDLYKCYGCRTFSTSRTGTLLEGSHLSCHTWFAAALLLIATDGSVGASTFVKLFGISNQTATRLRKQIMTQLESAGVRQASATAFRTTLAARASASIARNLVEQDIMAPGCMSPNARRRARLLGILRDVSGPEVERLFLELLDRMIFPRSLGASPPAGSYPRGRGPAAIGARDADKPGSGRR